MQKWNIYSIIILCRRTTSTTTSSSYNYKYKQTQQRNSRYTSSYYKRSNYKPYTNFNEYKNTYFKPSPPPKPQKDLWKILGVTTNASDKEIKKQYHRVFF